MVSRAAIIEDGVVVNITVAEPEFAAEQGWVVSETAAIGDLWDGETFNKPPAPPPAPPAIPARVSMRQGRQALLRVGLLDAVDAAIAGITDPLERRAAQIDWQHATEIRRDSPLIASLGPALGLSEAQIDQLFIAAGAIQ